jgi:NTP pyrophosphatase (non-canonical NTP hydrolase)
VQAERSNAFPRPKPHCGAVLNHRRPEPRRGAQGNLSIRFPQNRGSPTSAAGESSYDRVVDLAEYQRLSRRTAEYPREAWLVYPALGLSGEAGEVAEHAKKAIRDDGGEISDARRTAMAKELGDVLWYVAQLASELGLDLDEIAQTNLNKLLSRQRRGVLSGSGDDR